MLIASKGFGQLPQTVTLSGAGDIGTNQSYTLMLTHGGACMTDPAQFGNNAIYNGDANFDYQIWYETSTQRWEIIYNDPITFMPTIMYTNSASDCAFPDSNWVVSSGIAPSPVVVGSVNPCTNSTLTVTATILQQPCDFNSNGIAVATFSGGNNPSLVEWYADNGLGGGPTFVSSGDTLRNIPGSYYAQVTDLDNCTDTFTINLNGPSNQLSVSVSTTPQYRCTGGVQQGSATVTPSGGFSSGYSFIWKDSLGSNTISNTNTINQFAGRYNVTVTDANQCQITQQVQIPGINGVANILSDSTIHPTCSYINDGSIKIYAEQMVHDTLTYYLRKGYNGNFITSIRTNDTAIFTGLGADTFYVSIKENCIGDRGLLSGSNGGKYVLTESSNNCCQPTLDSISTTACNSYSSPSGKTFTTSGNYLDTLQSVGGCDSVITLQLTINQATASTDTTQAVAQYIWPITGDTLTTSGNYVDTLQSSTGCDSILSLNLTIIPPLSYTKTVSDTEICAGEQVSISIQPNPNAPYINNRGCVVCDMLNVGDTFKLSGIMYTVADSLMVRDSLENFGDLTKLCVSKITNMHYMLGSNDISKGYPPHYLSSFNQNISNWDVSNVMDMSYMFKHAVNFNQNISNWDVSSVMDMSLMFYAAYVFNQSLNTWNVSNVTKMSGMFLACYAFNGDVESWDVSNVKMMNGLFYDATSFNQDISNWDTKNVTTMQSLFNNAELFNQNLSSWDVSGVLDFSYMFAFTDSFNQDISSWDLSHALSTQFMFRKAKSFNQDISSWNVSNDTTFYGMFEGATSFNQNIGNWNMSSAKRMRSMFEGASSFNQNISNWDVSNVNHMQSMFNNATNFNQNLSNWCVTNITSEPTNFSTNSALAPNNKPVWGTCPP